MRYFRLIFAAFLLATLEIPIDALHRPYTTINEHNFDKMANNVKALLVKFDIVAPISPEHKIYEDFAMDYLHVKDLLVAVVEVHEYISVRENKDLAKRFGINGMNGLPATKLFLGNVTNFKTFNRAYTEKDLKQFVVDNTDIYMGLECCLKECDRLTRNFVTRRGDRSKIMDELENLHKISKTQEKLNIKIYIDTMRLIIERGADFISREIDRLKEIIFTHKYSNAKGRELLCRYNILHSFVI